MNQKLIVTICILVIFFQSCTIQVPESDAFSGRKYNAKEFKNYIQNYSDFSENQKLYYSQFVDSVNIPNKDVLLNINEVKMERKFLQLENYKEEYYEITPKNADKTIYFFLGNGSDFLYYASGLTQLSNQINSKIFCLNYIGYGINEGIPTFKKQFENNNSFYEFTKDKIVGKKIIMGYSLGSVFASYLGSEQNFDEIVLLSPVSSAKEYLNYGKKFQTPGIKSLLRPFMKLKTNENLMSISNTNKLKNFQNKLLIVSAKDDGILPYKMGKEIFDTNTSTQKELLTLQKGNHGAAFLPENWNTIIEKLK